MRHLARRKSKMFIQQIKEQIKDFQDISVIRCLKSNQNNNNNKKSCKHVRWQTKSFAKKKDDRRLSCQDVADDTTKGQRNQCRHKMCIPTCGYGVPVSTFKGERQMKLPIWKENKWAQEKKKRCNAFWWQLSKEQWPVEKEEYVQHAGDIDYSININTFRFSMSWQPQLMKIQRFNDSEIQKEKKTWPDDEW